MKSIAIVTEANEDVATGHLMESVELANGLAENGYRVVLYVNDNVQSELKERISCPFEIYPHDVETGKEDISHMFAEVGTEIAVFNLRRIEDATLRWFSSQYTGKIICIDELGHRNLSCDIIINPMIDPYYWDYGKSTAVLYSGPEYLALPKKIRRYHNREKTISVEIKNVCVSMGGVDIVGSTLKLAQWLPQILPNAHIDIVTGAGFPYTSELNQIVQGNHHIDLHRNIDYIYDLFYHSDLAFCAGGNTLHELACIGTPAIVVPSRPHEMRNGRKFEQLGFGICLPLARELTMEHVMEGVQRCSLEDVRHGHVQSGRKIVAGNGVEEMMKIIMGISK